MPGVEGLEQVGGLGPADFSDDNVIGPVAQGVAHQVPDRHVASGEPARLQPQAVGAAQPQLQRVLDGDDAALGRQQGHQRVQQRRLPGAARDEHVAPAFAPARPHLPWTETGAPTMPAETCTGALRRRLPTGHPSMAGPPGHKYPISARRHKSLPGSSRRPARPLRDYPRKVIQKGTGRSRLMHPFGKNAAMMPNGLRQRSVQPSPTDSQPLPRRPAPRTPSSRCSPAGHPYSGGRQIQ